MSFLLAAMIAFAGAPVSTGAADARDTDSTAGVAGAVDGIADIPGRVSLLLRAPDASWAAIWPGFDPGGVPVAIFDGARTWLFRHPAPPGDFEPAGEIGGEPLFARPGRDPAVNANASALLGDVRTATLLLDEDDSDERLRQVLLHESFHVYQRHAHPHWSANEADLFLYPFANDTVLAEARLELYALERAAGVAGRGDAGARGLDARRAWAKAAIGARDRRFAVLSREAIEYERETEWNEGTATYVEQTGFGWERFESLLNRRYPPEDVRQRAYVSGALLCRTLDLLRPEWRSELARHDSIPLDSLLAGAVPPDVTPAPLPADSVYAAARAEIALLELRKRERRDAFAGRPGYAIRIHALEEPLFTDRFDPLNVVVLEPGVVLHSRFVRLGNDRGSVEVFDWESISRASSAAHPLFAGVGELSVTGLRDEAAITFSGDTLSVESPPVRLRFAGATATVIDSVTVITLPGGP